MLLDLKRVSFCVFAGGDRERCSQHQRYWDIQLDQDLLDTIASIYPEWFKDMSDGGRLLHPPSSAPNSAHHHPATDKNKECEWM